MRVLIDDAPLLVSEPTLAAALDLARKHAKSLKRVVIEATIDGLTIPDEMLSAPSSQALDASEVRFSTADPIELVRSTLHEVANLLNQAKQEQTSAGELIQTGNLAPAMSHFSSALMVWENVQQVVVNGAALLGVEPENLHAESPDGTQTDVAQAVRTLVSRLTELKRAVGAQDWAGLADSLLFDMQEQADQWQVLLRRVAAQIGSHD